MQEKRCGARDRTYSVWHRRFSTRQFISIEAAHDDFTLIDNQQSIAARHSMDQQ